MFIPNLDLIKAQQAELHRQAAEYRLVQSLKKSRQWFSVIVTALGKMLITSGQQIVNRYQPAHTLALSKGD